MYAGDNRFEWQKKKNVPEDDILMYFQKYPEEGSVIFYILAYTVQSTYMYDLLGKFHFDLLTDLLSLLVTPRRKNVPVFQLLFAGTIPKLYSQQLLPHPPWQCACTYLPYHL